MSVYYTLRSDESGHDYMIKAEDSDEFERLLYDGTVEEFENAFGDCRCNFHTNSLTFTNPRINDIVILTHVTAEKEKVPWEVGYRKFRRRLEKMKTEEG